MPNVIVTAHAEFSKEEEVALRYAEGLYKACEDLSDLEDWTATYSDPLSADYIDQTRSCVLGLCSHVLALAFDDECAEYVISTAVWANELTDLVRQHYEDRAR